MFEGRDAFAVAEGVGEECFFHEALVGEVEVVTGVVDLESFFGHGGPTKAGSRAK